ncbi:MAG: hypothetical protein ACYDH8_15775 [Syntrophales bacterium]
MIDDLSGRAGTAEALLAQETVEIGEYFSSTTVVGSTGTSKRDEIHETISQEAGKDRSVHDNTSDQSRGSCLSFSKSILV